MDIRGHHNHIKRHNIRSIKDCRKKTEMSTRKDLLDLVKAARRSNLIPEHMSGGLMNCSFVKNLILG